MATNSPVTTSIASSNIKAKFGLNQQQQPQQNQTQTKTLEPVRAWTNTISGSILDDLGSRFIINVPEVERENLIRVCFQIELAHWFYLDFYCSVQKQKCGIKQFAFQLFQHIPFLQPHLKYVDRILEDWKQYKLSVPTYGAILLSEDLKHVLLVQSFWAKSSWSFPKGKINENEEPLHCAIREVYEETGYDIKNLIVPSEYIELVINYQYTRLYMVCGVPLATVFIPRTRNEIKCCEWFPIELLPVTKNENFVKDNLSMNGNSFFMILPFVKRLKKWLEKLQKNKHKGGNNNSPVFGSAGKQNKYFEHKAAGASNQAAANRQRQRHKSLGDIEQQQRSKSSGAQYFPNNQQQQQLAKNTPNNAAPPAEGYQEFSAGVVVVQPNSSTSNKKSSKKQTPGINLTVGAGAGGRSQTKRKLFDVAVSDGQTPPAASKEPVMTTGYESKAWLEFKLDYSKFL